MRIEVVTFDCETMYSEEYSLRRMTPAEYICDPRFEMIGAALRRDTHEAPSPRRDPATPAHWDAKSQWHDADVLPAQLAGIDWTRTALLSHNIGFDGAVLAWRYGIVPALYLDTLGLARATLPEAGGASLDKVLTHLGAPPKAAEVIHMARGWRLADFRNDPARFSQYQRYCERDCDGAWWIWKELAWNLNGQDGVGRVHVCEEILMMDAVARMTILPRFSLDVPVVRQHLASVEKAKANLVTSLAGQGLVDGANPTPAFQSSEQFAQLLRKLGVSPPMKFSPKTRTMIYAFAKTDRPFTDLQEHADPLVQAAVTARLGIRSTLEETRSRRFLDIAAVNWPAASNSTVIAPLAAPLASRMPFPLKYSGAHTHRLSGDWLLNLQNLGRLSDLRRAMVALPGYVIVSADASQIEARMVAWLAGCTRLVGAFASGEDVYATFATEVYGYRVSKETTPLERFVGKVGVLSLGYGAGSTRFRATVYNQGQRQVIDDRLALKVVGVYRQTFREITSYWGLCENVLFSMANRVSRDFGCVLVDAKDQSLILPNGMRLYYRNLRREAQRTEHVNDEGELHYTERPAYVFDYGKRPIWTYGAKLCENVTQSLARIITMSAATRVRKITGHVIAGQIHDQLIYVVPTQEAEAVKAVLVEEMSRQLDWWEGLPLACEASVGLNLLDAK